MNTDYRVQVGLPSHPKTIKLKRLIGASACEVILRLFEFTAINHPTGDLTGMDDETIAIAVGGEQAPIDLVAHLVKVGYLEGPENCRRVHDWLAHNPYAATAETRINRARKAASVRWGIETQEESSTDNAQAMLKDAKSNATSMIEQCPSVSLPTLPPNPALPPSLSPVGDKREEPPDTPSGISPPEGGKRPSKKFDPPSEPECRLFFAANGSTVEMGAKFWRHFDSTNWYRKSGVRIINWRSAALNWINERFMSNGARGSPTLESIAEEIHGQITPQQSAYLRDLHEKGKERWKIKP